MYEFKFKVYYCQDFANRNLHSELPKSLSACSFMQQESTDWHTWSPNLAFFSKQKICKYLGKYVVWQKSNETDFLLTMDFILFTNQGYPLQNVSLGQLHCTEALFPLFVAVLEGFCWYTFQLVGYTLLDIIQSTKMAPFQVVFEPGE